MKNSNDIKGGRANQDKRKRAYLRTIINTVKNKPCQDCGGVFSNPEDLTFDHLPQYKKERDINDAIKNRSLRQLLIEMAKCEIVCRPCHNHRELKRKRNMKHTVFLVDWQFSACAPAFASLDYSNGQKLMLDREEIAAVGRAFFEQGCAVMMRDQDSHISIFVDTQENRFR